MSQPSLDTLSGGGGRDWLATPYNCAMAEATGQIWTVGPR